MVRVGGQSYLLLDVHVKALYSIYALTTHLQRNAHICVTSILCGEKMIYFEQSELCTDRFDQYQ